jgi:hypothetical protein
MLMCHRLTPPMIHNPLDGPTRRYRRLRYKAVVDGEVGYMTFSWAYPEVKSKVDDTGEQEVGVQDRQIVSEGGWQEELGGMMEQMERELAEENRVSSTASASEANVSEDTAVAGEAVDGTAGANTSGANVPLLDVTTEAFRPPLEIVGTYGTLVETDILMPAR